MACLLSRKPVAFVSRRGFTLIEMMVSLFIFSLLMPVVAQIFSTAFTGYRSTRAVQHDIENAQYSMNVIAKELRTSSVVSASGSQTSVKFYDHSQGICFRYRVSGGQLEMASAASTDVADCTAKVLPALVAISTGTINGSFQVTPSVGGAMKQVGKVTISLEVYDDTAHRARIQTSVSLRDFGNIAW